MSMQDTLRQKLTERFNPQALTITDESYKHRGHSGFRPEGESHFKVSMVSSLFEGKNRVERQRMVYECLREELQQQIHALSLHLKTPEEAGDSGQHPVAV